MRWWRWCTLVCISWCQVIHELLWEHIFTFPLNAQISIVHRPSYSYTRKHRHGESVVKYKPGSSPLNSAVSMITNMAEVNLSQLFCQLKRICWLTWPHTLPWTCQVAVCLFLNMKVCRTCSKQIVATLQVAITYKIQSLTKSLENRHEVRMFQKDLEMVSLSLSLQSCWDSRY